MGVIIGHSPEKSTLSCAHPLAQGLVGQEEGHFDIFVDCRSRPVSPFKYLFLMSFHEWLPETATILAAGSPPSEGSPKQTDLIISCDSAVLQIFRAAGTGDASLSNRKHLLTERGHDQPTVKRPKENRRVFHS